MKTIIGVIFFAFIANTAIYADTVFIDNGDGTITDKDTGLMWQAETTWFDHSPCTNYCTKLELANHKDWQNPDIDTIKDLFNKKNNFPKKLKGEYWVGNMKTDSFGSRWIDQYYNVYFDFSDGFESKVKCTTALVTKKIRCVRVAGEENASNIPANVVLEWKRYGFTLSDIQLLTERYGDSPCKGLAMSPDEASKWKAMGFSVAETCSWRWAIKQPEQAKEWRNNKFTVDEARSWNYRYSPSEAAQWKELGLDIASADKWRQKELSAKEAKDWVNSDFDPAEAKDWASKGFAPGEVAGWQEVCKSSSEASKWKEKGFTAIEAGPWIKSDFKPDNALQWKSVGKTAQDASKWVGYSPDTAQSLGKTCKNGIGSLLEMVRINPYDTAGKCYNVGGSALQLLSRTKGLYSMYNFIFLIDFKNESANPNYFNGLVIGKGAYSYVDITGAQRIVPSFEKL